MLNFSSKYRFNIDKARPGVTFSDCDTVTFNAGDLKFRASKTNSTVINGLSLKDINGPCLNDFVLAIEKPDCFIVDYSVPKNDVRLQFMNTVKVANTTLNLIAVNSIGGTWRSLGGSLEINPLTKVYVNRVFGGNTKFRCHYSHNGSLRFEPSYNLMKNLLKVDVSYMQRVNDADLVYRATYKTSSDKLGLELTKTTKTDGVIKISASIDMADTWKMPKLCIENNWEIDLL